MLRQLLDYRLLIPLAIILGLAPFRPEPHLTQKLRFLVNGALTRPLDIFDLIWHATPLVLLGFKAGRDLGRKLRAKGDRP